MTIKVEEKLLRSDIDQAANNFTQYLLFMVGALRKYKADQSQLSACIMWRTLSNQMDNIQTLITQGFSEPVIGQNVKRKYNLSDTEYASVFGRYTTLKDSDIPAILTSLTPMGIAYDDVAGSYTYTDHTDLPALTALVDTALEFYDIEVS